MSDAPSSANQGIDTILAQIRLIISDEPEFAKPSGSERRQSSPPGLPPATPVQVAAQTVARYDVTVVAPALMLPAAEIPATPARAPEPLVDDFSDLVESTPAFPVTRPLAVAPSHRGASPLPVSPLFPVAQTNRNTAPAISPGPLPTPAQPTDAAKPTGPVSTGQWAVLQTSHAPAAPPTPVALPKSAPPPLPSLLPDGHVIEKLPPVSHPAGPIAARSVAAAGTATVPIGPLAPTVAPTVAPALAPTVAPIPDEVIAATVGPPDRGPLPSVKVAATPAAAVPVPAQTQAAEAVAPKQVAPGAPVLVQPQRMPSTAPPVFGDIDKRGKAPTSLADLLAGGLSLPGVAPPRAAPSARSIALPPMDQASVAHAPKVQTGASALGDLAAGLAATTGEQIPAVRPPQPIATTVSASAKRVVSKQLEDKILDALRPTVRQWLDANAAKLGDTTDKN